MNTQRLILYIFFFLSNLFIIQYYNFADAQIKGGRGGTPPSIEITAPTKISNSSITDTTIRVIDDQEFIVNDVEVSELTTSDVSNFNCSYTAEYIVCGFSGCDVFPPTANCTISIDTSGDLEVIAFDADTLSSTESELGYIIEEPQMLQSSSSSHSKSSGTRFTCKDQKALNYDRFGRHDASRCRYPKNIKISEVMMLNLTNRIENLILRLRGE